MSEILGLLDSVEAAILEARRVPLSDYVILDEKKLLLLLDKLRLTLQSKGRSVYENLDQEQYNQDTQVTTPGGEKTDIEIKRQEALNLRKDADEYADRVLANLLLLVTKMQKNLINMEKNLETGRDMLKGTYEPTR